MRPGSILQKRLGLLSGMLVGLGVSFAPHAQAEIAATHIYHNHMPNFWPYYDVTQYDRLSVGAPIRYTYDGYVINLKNSPPSNYTYYLPDGKPMPHDDLVSYYSHHAKTGAYMSWPWDTATQNNYSHKLSQTQVTMSGAVVNNVQSLNELQNVSGYSNTGWGYDWKRVYDSVKTNNGKRALDLIHFTGHHSMGPLVGNEYFLKDLIYQNATLAQPYFLGSSFVSSKGFFPTELGFSERLIPTLKKLGVEWSVLGNVHYSRTLQDYPYLNDPGMDCMISPPNRADLQNVSDIGEWVSLQMYNEAQVTRNKFPFASIPHWVEYVDPSTGQEFRLAGIPVEQASSWEEGYQGSVTAGVLKSFEDEAARLGRTQYFVIAHDGDNSSGRAGDGGTWLNSGRVTYSDSGVVGKGVDEYLLAHPIPSTDLAHVQDGSWIDTRDSSSDPTWYHWRLPMGIWKGQFSDFNRVMGTTYEPKRNLSGEQEGMTVSLEYGYHYLERNFALLQASLNYAKTAEQIWLDTHPNHWKPTTSMDNQVTYGGNQLNPWMYSFPVKGDANNDWKGGANPAELSWYFILGALDSGFGYYDENTDDHLKPTISFNQSLYFAAPYVNARVSLDRTGPSVWWPQRYPYNPGSANKSKAEGWTLHYFNNAFALYTYAYDVSGIQNIKMRVRVHKSKRANPQDKTYQVYDPSAFPNDPRIKSDNVSAWVDYPLKKRELTPDMNGVAWQASTQQTMAIVPAQKIGDLYYVYLNDYRDQLLDYYVEATDAKGNVTRSEIQQVYVGTGRYKKDASGKLVEDLAGDVEGTHPFLTDKPPSKAVTLYIEGLSTSQTSQTLESRLPGQSWSAQKLANVSGQTGWFKTGLTYTTDFAGVEVRAVDGSSYRPSSTGSLLTAGTWTIYKDGSVKTGAPSNLSFTATVYYKTPYNTSSTYQHWRPAGGTWTTSPGAKMSVSEYAGYTTLTVPLGAIDQMEAVFNNGSGTWDNNGGKNYFFPAGVSTLVSGKISAGTPTDVGAGNKPPVADAGDDVTVSVGKTFLLDGSGSYDPDGRIVSYQWSNNASGEIVEATLASPGAYTYTLTVTDDKGATSSDSVVITAQSTVQNQVTIYYKRGFDTPYIHYKQPSGVWTTVPGVAMPQAEVAGYNVVTLNIGALTQLEAVFNNGKGTWDNNGGKNYFFGVGTWIFDAGKISAGTPQVPNEAPLAVVNPGDLVLEPGAVQTFSGRESLDGDGSIVAFAWALDGLPVGTGPDVTLTFDEPGVFYLSLTVTDDDGAIDTEEIEVAVEEASTFVGAYPQLYFRGTANAWATTGMKLVADHLWQVDVRFTGGSSDRFKFDVYGDWKVNFGDTNKDGVAEQGGADIYVTLGQGDYRITFEDVSKKYTVSRVVNGLAYVLPSLYFRGTPNNWASSAMKLVADNTWEVTVTFAGQSTDRFKLDVYGDWKVNYGDTNKDGVAEQGGADIYVSGGGARVIRFHDLTRAYSVVKPTTVRREQRRNP
ncbi:MAG: carbohydrate binding domain-containing protein [Myxococcota bacterium]